MSNPDTLTKYKTAAQIGEKVLAAVSKLIVPGAKIVDICEKGDKLLEEEIAKVYRGKKVTKGRFPVPMALLLNQADLLPRLLPPHHCLSRLLRDPLHPPQIR